MLNLIFKRKEARYMDWSEYKEKIDFLSFSQWQQNIRKESVKNLLQAQSTH